MYEFRKIESDKNIGEKVIKCGTCSPLLRGKPAVLFTDIEGHEQYVRTSAITEVSHPEPKVAIIKTESGSTYEIREI
jgi:hypothetical protein